MFFELSDLVAARWLLLIHIVAAGIFAFPFLWVGSVEQFRELRRIFRETPKD